MKTANVTTNTIWHIAIYLSAPLVALLLLASPSTAVGTTVIELNQLPCQFLESENEVDHGYKSKKKSDCESINGRTAKQRLATVKPLALKAGKYLFRVTNKSVPYDLGFWLRGEGLVGRATLPSVSGGGLTTGASRDYEIELKPGRYLYSCPLNTTPDYALLVTE